MSLPDAMLERAIRDRREALDRLASMLTQQEAEDMARTAVAAVLAGVEEGLREPHHPWCSCLLAACDCGHDAAVLDLARESGQ